MPMSGLQLITKEGEWPDLTPWAYFTSKCYFMHAKRLSSWTKHCYNNENCKNIENFEVYYT